MLKGHKDRILGLSDIVLIVILAIELLFLIYVNLFRLTDVIDVDFARVLRHTVEMGDRRQLFLPNWNYITTAELDHSALFAIPLYILTGNIMVSYGIANLINIALWCFVLCTLLELTGLKRRYRLLAAVLVFTFYDFGMLAYTNMLFFGAGHYTHKVLIPLMFVTLMLMPADRRRKPASIILYVICAGLLFVTSVSSGIYVFICGIFPVIAYTVFTYIIKGQDESGRGDIVYHAIMSLSSVLVAGGGIIVCKVRDISPNSELAMIKYMDEIRENPFSTFLDLMEMFRVFPEKSTPVMSLGSVMSILRLFIFAVILIAGLHSVGKKPAEQMLITVFLWNYFILFVSGSQQRYHILGAVPLMICAVIRLSELMDKDDDLRLMLYISLIMAVVLLNLYQVLWGSRQYLHREDYSKAVNSAVIGFMEENDAGTAFAVYESGYGMEWLRAADKTRHYETYIPDTGEVVNHDFYHSDKDRSEYTDRNVIMATSDEYENCPYYIKENYVLKTDIYNYDLYISEHNPIDGIAGEIEGMDAIDLATSPGYDAYGIIDSCGYLDSDPVSTGDAGEVIVSPELDITLPCTWILNYSKDTETESVVELYMDGSLTDTLTLEADREQVRYVFPQDGEYKIIIRRSGDGGLKIREMEFNTTGIGAQ